MLPHTQKTIVDNGENHRSRYSMIRSGNAIFLLYTARNRCIETKAFLWLSETQTSRTEMRDRTGNQSDRWSSENEGGPSTITPDKTVHLGDTGWLAAPRSHYDEAVLAPRTVPASIYILGAVAKVNNRAVIRLFAHFKRSVREWRLKNRRMIDPVFKGTALYWHVRSTIENTIRTKRDDSWYESHEPESAPPKACS